MKNLLHKVDIITSFDLSDKYTSKSSSLTNHLLGIDLIFSGLHVSKKFPIFLKVYF